MGRLQDKSVIITGAASGIGRAAAIRFANEGAHVMLADMSDTVHQVAEDIDRDGGHAIAMVMDAGLESDIQALVAKTVEIHGGIDVLFANAGITGSPAPLADQSVDDWMNVMRVNLIGPMVAIRAAAPEIAKRGGGSIICTASTAGLRSSPGPMPYSASKAALINLVQTSANQLAGANVRVNAICPGLVQTGMTQPVFDKAISDGIGDRLGMMNPLRRTGQANEIADLALFLASDESSFINGQAVAVDGGLSSSHPFAPYGAHAQTA